MIIGPGEMIVIGAFGLLLVALVAVTVIAVVLKATRKNRTNSR
jgi:CHASE1-domain containing sensor protein